MWWSLVNWPGQCLKFYHRISDHAESLHKNATKNAEYESKIILVQMSSVGIRRQILCTTRKLSDRPISESLHRCWGWRKQDSQCQKQKSVWPRFSMTVVSFTVSSCHLARQLIIKSSRRSCHVCFSHCSRCDEIFGRINCGCFITITHLLTNSWAYGSSWPGEISPDENKLPIQSDLVPCHFSFFQAQMIHQGKPLSRFRDHLSGRYTKD